MKKKTKVILSSIVAVLLILVTAMTFFIGSQVFAASTQLVTNEETKGVTESFWKKYGINIQEFRSTYTIEPFAPTSSFDGHQIPAEYIYAEESKNQKNNKTVVLVHGLGGNRYSNYPLAEFFLREGYNVITYDQRSSNENTARYTTFGYWEKYDLIDCLRYAREQAPGKQIGIWGTSFGGATAGLALGYENTQDLVDFLILDCPVSSMQWMIEQEMAKMNLGIPLKYMTWCGSIYNKLKLGFTYAQADVGKAMTEVNTRVLIINSKKDAITPGFMGEDIFEALPDGKKQLWTVEDSEHAQIWLDYNKQYREKVHAFIQA